MAVKPYTIKKTINGKEYVAQFNGMSAALDAADSCYMDDGSGNHSAAKMTKYLFDNVIVEPKNLTADDFASLKELNEVTTFARQVMQGEFRNEENEGATDKKG